VPRLLLGVSGGIAAYKVLEVVRLATDAGYAVRVIQTPASRQFVGAASFAALSGAPVLSETFERDPETRCAAATRAIRFPSMTRRATWRSPPAPTST
jgi:phosphopantothenoylcysteine synthetase/decarboxylase